jgi:hypothetical protein
VPVPAGRHEHRAPRRLLRLTVADNQQPSAEQVDRLVELVVRVLDGPGEVRWDGNLHRGESRRLAAVARQDVHRLASIRECRSLARRVSMVMGSF